MLLDRAVTGVSDKFLTLIADEIVLDSLSLGVAAFDGNSVVSGGKGIGAVSEVYVIGTNIVDPQHFDIIVFIEVIEVIVKGISDTSGRVFIGSDTLHKVAHCHDHCLCCVGMFIYRQTLHDHIFHSSLAAGAFGADIRYDLLIVTADLSPVSDLAGVDGLYLFESEGIDGIIYVCDKDEAVVGDRSDLQFNAVFRSEGKLLIGRFGNDDDRFIFFFRG